MLDPTELQNKEAAGGRALRELREIDRGVVGDLVDGGALRGGAKPKALAPPSSRPRPAEPLPPLAIAAPPAAAGDAVATGAAIGGEEQLDDASPLLPKTADESEAGSAVGEVSAAGSTAVGLD